MIPEYFGYLSIVIGITGISFYIRDIIRGKTKPNLVTWIIWTLAPFIGTFLQLKAGAGLSVLPVFMAGFTPLLVLIVASIKRNSVWKITTFDIICGILSIISLVLWLITKNTDISLLFAILADGLAAVPTLVKAWKYPDTETALGYIPGVINNAIGLLIITNWSFSIYSFGIYFIIMNASIIFCIYRKKLFKFKEA